MIRATRNNELNWKANLLLFLTSYIPLFILISLRTILKNRDFLFDKKLKYELFKEWLLVWGLPTCLIFVSIVSLFLCYIFFQKLNKDAENGYTASILKIENRNNETLGYIASYILPFISTDSGNIVEIATFIFLMIIIYTIYVHSNMILINPLLNIKYSLYNIEYVCGKDKPREGLVIVKGHDVYEDERLKLYQIGFKIFYGKKLS